MNNRKLITMESVLKSDVFKECHYELPIILGKTAITNEIIIKDLTRLHHILVGGSTGQGKTTSLHAMITSLINKKQPSEMRLVLIAPKRCEFNKYAYIGKNYLAEIPSVSDLILTDNTKATQALKNLCDIVDNRHKLLKMADVRSIQEYNEKYKNGDLSNGAGHDFMPYIVIVVDEFGELMIARGKEAEVPMVRLAEIGHRVGLHLIIATQRLVPNVITGVIRANFPTCIAFRIATSYESRMIINSNEATQLMGNGDMMFASVDEKIHVQGAFVE